MEPLVSIITPVFNREELVIQAVTSVQVQTHAGWELVVVDDHSTDGTKDALKVVCREDPRVRFVSQEEGVSGAAAARNLGFRLSRGEHVLFLDSDDLLHPGCLARRVQALENNPNCGLTASLCSHFEDTPDPNAGPDRDWTDEDDLQRFLRFANAWHTGGVLWRRNTLEAIGGWREDLTYYQDWELSLRAIVHGYKCHRIELVDWYLRRDNRPRISNVRRRHHQDTWKLLCAVRELASGTRHGDRVAKSLPSICMTLTRRHALAGDLPAAIRLWLACWRKGCISHTAALVAMPLFLVSSLKRYQRPFQKLAQRYARECFE